MADVKWIKLATDIFDNKKIRQIESMPEGESIIVIWLKLLCLAGNLNENGSLYFTPEIPYTEQMLATQFNRPLMTVQLALKTFIQFHMIDVIDDVLHVSAWEKYQNVEGLDKIREQTRERVARHREKVKNNLLPAGTVCQYCGSAATGFDHIIAIARGGADTEENKVPCCADCNRIKNDKPLVSFLNANRDRINDEIVLGNAKLKNFVTLSNVTNRYEVTHGNETDIDIDRDRDIEIDNRDIPPYSPPTGGENAEKKTTGTLNGKTVDTQGTTVETQFERFWKVYPKHKGKEAARKAFARVYEKKGVSVETLIAAVEKQKTWADWQKENGKYIKNPSTWLNQGCWEDEEYNSGINAYGRTTTAVVYKGGDFFDDD